MKNKTRHFFKALDWIKANTVDGKGIAVTSKKQVVYPEVTGYYIPSLLQWGERDLALSYARHLCSIQKEDGSWYDSADKAPYVFDSAQILKGLIAVRELLPEVDAHIVRGCDWILSNMQPDGRLVTPSKDAWASERAAMMRFLIGKCAGKGLVCGTNSDITPPSSAIICR